MSEIQPINPQKVQERMTLLGYKQASLAKVLKVDQTLIGKILLGKVPHTKHLPALARTLGTSSDYLTDLTDDAEIGAPKATTADILNRQIAMQNDLIQISEVDVSLGMGGVGFLDDTSVLRQLSFPRIWVEQFTTSPSNKLFIAKGFGDSMYPTIGDGDIVLIDTSQNNPIISDKIWAITYYGGGQIKRLRHHQGGFKILSDNPNVPEEIAMDGEMHVIGRVVAVVRRV